MARIAHSRDHRVTRHSPDEVQLRLGRYPATVTVQYCAKLCGVEDRTVRKWIKFGWVRTIRVGWGLRLSGAEMHRILILKQKVGTDNLISVPRLGDALRNIYQYGSPM